MSVEREEKATEIKNTMELKRMGINEKGMWKGSGLRKGETRAQRWKEQSENDLRIVFLFRCYVRDR